MTDYTFPVIGIGDLVQTTTRIPGYVRKGQRFLVTNCYSAGEDDWITGYCDDGYVLATSDEIKLLMKAKDIKHPTAADFAKEVTFQAWRFEESEVYTDGSSVKDFVVVDDETGIRYQVLVEVTGVQYLNGEDQSI